MRRLVSFSLLLLIVSLACSLVASKPTNTPVSISPTDIPIVQNTESPQAVSALPESALVNIYDPTRDPAQDLEQAIVVAQNENKRIMLELGGDWCIWCRFMDEFYATHPDILQYRADHYVLVKINVSEENRNEEFLSQYPEVGGYPHIFILESDGTFLHSQDTALLEDGGQSYVPEVFMAFLEKWAPQ